MQIHNMTLRPVSRGEEPMFKALMQQHHYLGWLPKIGNTIWYIAIYQNKWQALLIFSAAALKCRARVISVSYNTLRATIKNPEK